MKINHRTHRRFNGVVVVDVAMVPVLLLSLELMTMAMTSAAESVDLSTDPYIFETDTLTTNIRHMPSVGNGHLATNVYSSSVCVNGLYNGETGWSHRAQVESPHARNLSAPVECQSRTTHTYRLNIWDGVYEETIRLTSSNVTITYRVYAHQFYTRLLITEVEIERPQSNNCVDNDPTSVCCNSSIDFVVDSTPLRSLADEDDFTWSDRQNYTEPSSCSSGSCTYQTGQITVPETDTTPKSSVHMYWNEMPTQFVLPAGETRAQWSFLLAVDTNNNSARADFDAAIQANRSELWANHSAAFNEIWRHGDIHVEGDLHLQKVIRGCLYYLYTSLPSHTTNSPNNQFYGLSPGGLPNGANHTDYQGHVFWDMETWMYPPILMFRPDLARDMLSYRMAGIKPAIARAESGGYRGARFPWESAQTGVEVTPVICIPCRENQQHITGDIAFAARQYVSATLDRQWLQTPHEVSNFTGFEFIQHMAAFWESRPSYNLTRERFEINGVMPPDEHAEDVDNSIYTNVMASYSIHSARYAACVAGKQPIDEVPDRWIHVAKKLAFPFNSEKRYHEEFDGYDFLLVNKTSDPRGVKQADVVMLGYPLMWSMPDDVRQNDLEHYENVTNPMGPAMTWGIFSVGWLDLENHALADQFFNKSYQSYAHDPFQIWTEDRVGNGAINFITGMGGFLQAVMFGYGGLRLDVEQLHVKRTRLPPETNRLRMQGLDYLGTEFDLDINSTTVVLIVTTAGPTPLRLTSANGVNETIGAGGFSRSFDADQEFTLSPASSTGCPPFDQPAIDVVYPSASVSTTSTAPTTTDAISPATTAWRANNPSYRYLQIVVAVLAGLIASSY